MALPSTIFKAVLDVADTDRHHYMEHVLTVARHPSETDERMMARVLAFALHASESLSFGRGLSATEEPDLWERDLTGRVALWVEVGQPDARRIRKACARADRVVVYAYGGRSVDLWWGKTGPEVARLENLSVFALDPAASEGLAALAGRTMRLQAIVQDGEALLISGDDRVPVVLRRLSA
jgi:uncharacterized protein YaeQ